MVKFASFGMGLAVGLAVGAALVLLYTPAPGSEVSARLRQSYADTLAEARQASADRRRELEARLADLRQRDSSTP